MTTLEQWHAYMTASGHSHNTAALRVRTIEALLRQAGVKEPVELTRIHVLNFLARPIRPWTRLTYWQGIERLSEFLREFGIDPTSDLTAGIKRPRTPEPVARPVTDDTIAKLLGLRMSPRPYAYVRLALYEALRVHEIAHLRGEDFDHDSGWLMVTGKGGVTAPIPIHPEITRMAEGMPEFGYWFPAPSDPQRPVSAAAVSRTIGNALREVGSPASAHQLRDTAATRMQRQVKDLRVTQAMLRHRNVRSTQKYTKVANDDLAAAVTLLDWSSAA